MLKPNEAESVLDTSPHVRQARPKEKNSAVYVTKNGRYLALERRLKAVAKVHIEPSIDPTMIGLSPGTQIEHLTPTVARVHLPVSSLVGPYKGKPGNAAWRIRLASEQDLMVLLAAYDR